MWLIDTSGDWMHLIPGVTAIALCGAAVLCDPRHAAPAASSRPPPGDCTSLIAAAAAVLVLAIGGASLLRATVARHYLDRARAELVSDPQGAIAASQQALRVDEENLDAYYVKAAGEARLNLARDARDTLFRRLGPPRRTSSRGPCWAISRPAQGTCRRACLLPQGVALRPARSRTGDLGRAPEAAAYS